MSAPATWFYIQDGKRQRPVGLDELVDRILEGNVSREGLVWHEGLADWAQAGSLPEIASQLPPPIPTPPPLPKSALAAPLASKPDRPSVSCPKCGLPNPSRSRRCACGYDFASGQTNQRYVREKNDCKLAGEALQYALVGIFCFGIILEPIAIHKARQAQKMIEADPTLSGAGKAKAALIIGTIMLILWCLGLLGRFLEEMQKVTR